MHMATEALWALEHEVRDEAGPVDPALYAEKMAPHSRQRTCQRCEGVFDLDLDLAYHTGKAWIGPCCLVKMKADELSILSLEA